MSSLPTVKIQDGAGYLIINKADFDPNVHTLYDPNKKPKPKRRTRKK